MKPKMSKEAILDWSMKVLTAGGETSTYRIDFMVESDFGVPGAITACNKYQKEFFLESVAIEGVVHELVCKSWIQPEKIYAGKRIFFSNKVINYI